MSVVLNSIAALAPKIAESEISRIEAVLENSRTADDMNKLVLHHSLFQSNAAQVCGVSLNTFKERVAEALAQGIIPDVLFENNKYKYTLSHVHALMDFMGRKKWSDEKKGCVVLNVQNQKGGSGKSTTVISIAMGVALRLQERRRVLVVDLDPQGTLRVVAAPELTADSDLLSAVDVMLGPDEPNSPYQQLINAGNSEADILASAILKTHIPNLDIIPAFPTDERFSSLAWAEYSRTGKLRHVELLAQRIIEPLRDQYDVIIIDTGPHTNPLTWSAMEGCNSILVPVSTRKLDWVSTGQFISSIPDQYSMLPSQGENLKYFKVVAVNYDEEQGRDLEILNTMKSVLGAEMLNSVIKRSKAFEAATRYYRTIYDIRKSDALCPDKQLDKAISSSNDVVRELFLSLNVINFNKEVSE